MDQKREKAEKVFFNFNCGILSEIRVRIGSRTLFRPNVQVYAAPHPLSFKETATALEFAKPVNNGEDVWIGGSALICPGINKGDRTVIGAGSVITEDIPSGVFAAGNPCKVIRKLEEGAEATVNGNGRISIQSAV